MSRIGILTSWRAPCGIAEYSHRLADALAQVGETPVILAARADDGRSVPEESEYEVHDVAKIGLWRDDQVYDIDMMAIANLEPLDVLHVQYQSMLLNQTQLQTLADWYRQYGPVAITFHDNCQAPSFPYQSFDLHFSHRWNVGPPTVEVIPFGIEDRPPVVRTFGLGRTRSDYIRPICERNGWVFEDIASHEPIFGGGQQWRTHEELVQWLRGADAIVLWYDDAGQAGSSLAARTALAARRPLITNDTKWFEDLPDVPQSYYTKAHGLDDLERTLAAQFDRPYVEQNSWDVVVQTLLRRYDAVRVIA